MSFEEVTERLIAERARVSAAARAARREPEHVKLLAVSKKHPPAAVRAAHAAGQRDFGENYVQELVEKAEALADLEDIRWHLIGHLQSNKAKAIVSFVDSVQTVSSVKLARELGKRVRDRRDPARGDLRVLIEVNVAGEASKSGCSADEVEELLCAIEEEERLSLRGLMTIPPFFEDARETRPFFEKLVELRGKYGETRLPELSMGMSHDAEIAIDAGATWVRIGTAIFGAR